MFRLIILSKIDIKSYLRSDPVIKSHQRSNLSKTCQKRVKSGCLIPLYALTVTIRAGGRLPKSSKMLITVEISTIAGFAHHVIGQYYESGILKTGMKTGMIRRVGANPAKLYRPSIISSWFEKRNMYGRF